MIEPRWWRQEPQQEDGRERFYICGLCPRRCRLASGQTGFCRARGMDQNGFISPYLGRFCSIAVDPIEKKPINCWRPGTAILSLGSLGCTMNCLFCQNHTIAQPQTPVPLRELSPDKLLETALAESLPSVAYTYNEPALQGEYILHAAPKLREAGVATVLVTNGQFTGEAISELSPWVDAANVDVKTFNPATYARLGGSLAAVQNTVSTMLGNEVHVELTTLVVPGISDDQDEFSELVDWIASLSPAIPFHISRYFPAHKYSAPPTSLELLRRFEGLAKARLKRVFLGNVR